MTVPPNQQADEVWEKTLPLIRARRTRRRRINAAIITSPLIALIAAWALIRPAAERAAPAVAMPAPPAPGTTLVVMRVGENGVTRLEELPAGELGSVELAFGLTPLLADESRDW
jgi:hypothetical protein